MERLSGLDAGFLYLETPAVHMHTLKVAVLGGNERTAEGFEALRGEIQRHLPLLPPLRRRLVEVPLGLHHPVWIEDPDFDLAAHVHRRVLPSPGDRRQLEALIAEVAGRPLDRSRPLWRMEVVEGLAGDRLAVVVQIHHALADGEAAAALLANVMGATAGGGREVPEDRWRPEPVPSAARLAVGALADHGRQLVRLPGLLVRTAASLRALVRRRRSSSVAVPLPVLASPRTSFNAALTARRSFASTTLPLADARRVRAAFGVTLNDVVLATVGGALRAVLAERGELPRRSLTAAVPIATRPTSLGPVADRSPRLAGNQVSNLFTTLGTDEADPARRLRRVHDVTAEAKAVAEVLGPDLLGAWAQYAPPRPSAWVARQCSRRQLARRHPPPVNVVVSNVPGPAEPLEVGGAQLESICSVGPVIEGIGLNVTVWSYVDQLHVGILGCRAMVPDPHRIAEALVVALDDLVAAAGATAEATTEAR